MALAQGKLKSLTIEEKLKLIELVESGKSVKEVAEMSEINKNTLHYILKSRVKIRESINLNPNMSGFKRIKLTKSPELEQRILDYMYDSQEKYMKLSGSIIKTVALEIASELNITNFAASNGWLFSFFKRNNITISEFNKGHDLYAMSKAQTSGHPIIDDEEPRVEVVEIQFEKQECEEEIEMVYEEEPGEEAEGEEDEGEYYEESEVVQEASWRSWCRVCGNRETLSGLEFQHSEIMVQLYLIPPSDIRVCEECNNAFENISKMVMKGRMVEAMFSELEDCEQSGEHVTDSKMADIRAAIGLDAESTAPTEASPTEASPIETASLKASPSPSIKAEPEFTIEEDFADEEAQILELDDEEELYEEMETSSTMDELELVNDESEQYEIDEETMVLAIEEEISLPKDPANGIEEFSYDFKCHVCGEVFDQMCFLANHARNAHHVHPKVACSCGRMLSTWESLMAHKRKHEPLESNFTCEICDATFRTKPGLSIHIKFKHEKPATIHECEICSRQFKEKSVLKAHVRTHLPDSEKYTSECKTCFKRFVNKWSLKYHISTIHDRVQNHFCQLCGRGFGNKSNLRSHLISHSTENVSCDICGGRFKNKISLQSHKKIHKAAESRKFTCEMCPKKFYNQNHLRRHLTTHSEERKFKCPYEHCISEYKWQKDLNNHIAGVHTGERPHKCFFCDRGFVDAGNARKHRLKEHPEEVAAFEAEYGKGRRLDYLTAERLEVTLE